MLRCTNYVGNLVQYSGHDAHDERLLAMVEQYHSIPHLITLLQDKLKEEEAKKKATAAANQTTEQRQAKEAKAAEKERKRLQRIQDKETKRLEKLRISAEAAQKKRQDSEATKKRKDSEAAQKRQDSEAAQKKRQDSEAAQKRQQSDQEQQIQRELQEIVEKRSKARGCRNRQSAIVVAAAQDGQQQEKRDSNSGVDGENGFDVGDKVQYISNRSSKRAKVHAGTIVAPVFGKEGSVYRVLIGASWKEVEAQDLERLS